MSGYVATLENRAGSLFKERPSGASKTDKKEAWTLSNALASCWRVHEFRKSLVDFRCVMNLALTGNKDTNFYALDTMFIERSYLMDSEVQAILKRVCQICRMETVCIGQAIDEIEECAAKSGFCVRHILRCVNKELYECGDIMDSCVFALEEVIAYAKNNVQKEP